MRFPIFPPIPIRVFTFTASVALLCSAACADDQVTAVQEALKEQQFFFGELNGKRDDETRAAVRRFQIHSGLPVSGEIDSATLAAVENRTPDDAAAPDAEPQAERSVRGEMRNVVRSDEEFLKDVESTDPLEEPAADIPPAPVAPARPLPPIAEGGRTPQVEVPPPPARRSEPAAPRVRPPEPEPIAQDELPPAPRREGAGSRPAAAQTMSEAEAQRFVKGYLDAAEGDTPDGEVAHFADRVDYFTSGRVNRRFIEKDQQNYYRRWTEREFDLLGSEVIKSAENSATIRFRTQYALRGSKDRASGRIENVVRLTREGGEWKIASIRERKLGK